MKAKKTFGIFLSALILASLLTACNKDKPADTTPAPTAKTTEAAVTVQPTTEITETAITEVPAVETTEDIAPEPVKYNEQDYKLLRDFFELADKDGVKNGEKCFKDYNPDAPSTWGKIGEKKPYVYWNENGRASYINIGYSDIAVLLSGVLDLTDLKELHIFEMSCSCNDAIRLTEFEYIDRLHAATNDEVYIEGRYIDDMHVASGKHIYSKLQDWPTVDSDSTPREFILDLTVEGAGRIGVSAYNGEPCYIVGIKAFPYEGHKFIGWFDKDGKLVSTEADYDLTSYADPADPDSFFGCEGEFIYTAKFE